MTNKSMEKPSGPKKLFTSLLVGIVGLIAGVYLLNPTGLSLDTAFDNVPFLGNLDEATAIGLLLSCLAYFGLDLNRIFGIFGFARNKTAEKKESGPAGGIREAQGRVVNEK